MADLGIAASPVWWIQEDLKAGEVQEILRDFAPPPVEINAVYPSARHVSAKVRAFTEFLKTEFEKIPALRVR
jgi:DNA-binding transcriptional LysR family regulator